MLDSAGPPPFRVDRPFASAVTDRVTDTILFLGTVHDPRGGCHGGVIAVDGFATARIGPSVAARLLRGEHPALALRAAQLAHLQMDPHANVSDALGLVCVSDTAATPQLPPAHATS